MILFLLVVRIVVVEWIKMRCNFCNIQGKSLLLKLVVIIVSMCEAGIRTPNLCLTSCLEQIHLQIVESESVTLAFIFPSYVCLNVYRVFCLCLLL